MLINLQPYAEPMQVEVRLGGERRAVGTARDSADKCADMRASLRRVAELVAAGLLSPRDEANWRLEMEFSSREDWREFAEKPTCGGIEADPRRLEEALARPDGTIILTEDDLAAVYERVDAPSTSAVRGRSTPTTVRSDPVWPRRWGARC